MEWSNGTAVPTDSTFYIASTAIYNSTTVLPPRLDACHPDFRQLNRLEYTYLTHLRIILCWFFFLLSSFGNFIVFASVTIWRRQKDLTSTHLIMMHLSLANLFFTFFVMPLGELVISSFFSEIDILWWSSVH